MKVKTRMGQEKLGIAKSELKHLEGLGVAHLKKV